MNLAALNQLTSEVYIILAWGLGSSQTNADPTRSLAERIYRTSWVDTRADGATYNVGASIRKFAPQLSRQEGIQLVLECHRALRDNVRTIQSMSEVPPRLHKYVS